MGNTETLLLIYYCQTEVFKYYTFLDNLMSTDKDIYFALSELADNFSLLFGTVVYLKELFIHGKRCKSSGSCLRVLIFKNCCGSEYSALFA